MNKINIMDEEWDYLIILDACRYDYFEKIWKKYFNTGKLSKKRSVGSSTFEWRDKTFRKKYDDLIYVSSNPYINSSYPIKGFLARKYFSEVYDLWDHCWDEEKGTALPEIVTENAIKIISNAPNKKFIIHYLQPHAPYLTLKDDHGFPIPDLFSERILIGIKEGERFNIRKRILKISSYICKRLNILGNPNWKIRQLLLMDPASPMDAIRRKYGKTGLRKAYMENLKVVLSQVQILTGHLSGKIIVTSDHGELLGEDGFYGHWDGSNKSQLIEIPWLILNNKKRTQKNVIADRYTLELNKKGKISNEKEKVITERLRKLGYIEE